MQHWNSPPKDYFFPEADPEPGSVSADAEAAGHIIEIATLAHGVLDKIRMYAPTTGSSSGFSFNLYASRDAAEQAAMEAPVGPWKTHQLLEEDLVFDGTELRVEPNLVYSNFDGSQTNRKRKLYLVSLDHQPAHGFQLQLVVRHPEPV